jgi:hypothetical protein
MLARRSKLRIAPMRHRFLAALIDGILAIVSVPLIFGGALLVGSLMDRKQALQRARPLMKKTGSARGKLTLGLGSFALGVLLTGRQSLGSRIVGIRLVDAGTGTPISRRQAVVHVGARAAWHVVTGRLTSRLRSRAQAQIHDLQPEVEALAREHAGDGAALERALKDFYRERRVRPFASCLPALIQAAVAVLIDVPLPWSRLHQKLPEMLTGTVVILDR